MQSLRSASYVSHRSLKAAPNRNPQIGPVLVPTPKNRQKPLLVKLNLVLRNVLIALSGIAILGYGLDVATSSDVSKLQDQARRLSEQNSELSAQLLHTISFQGIADNAKGHLSLRVPEQVLIVKEISSDQPEHFKAHNHHLPLLAGY